MQGFVFISFILISLFNARFRFHHHFIFLGGFIVNINKLYDFEMRALFSFPISEWILMRVHAEVDCFWLILPPFSGWLQKISVKQIFFPWLVQAREIKVIPELPSAVFSVCQNCYQKLVFCWHVFWQIQTFQIHKLVSRHDHLNISTMYSVFDWKEF